MNIKNILALVSLILIALPASASQRNKETMALGYNFNIENMKPGDIHCVMNANEVHFHKKSKSCTFSFAGLHKNGQPFMGDVLVTNSANIPHIGAEWYGASVMFAPVWIFFAAGDANISRENNAEADRSRQFCESEQQKLMLLRCTTVNTVTTAPVHN